MFRSIKINSHRGQYEVIFNSDLLSSLNELLTDETHFIIDKNVADLYAKNLSKILQDSKTIIIEATEENKAIDNMIWLFKDLVNNKIKKNHILIAIGGGIVQDITCFVASTLLRGLRWHFIPTTLLAQADSCIGSKSSINLGTVKNILGTFNPPDQVILCTKFLETLENKDMQSGIGEIIKVHAIDGQESFSKLKSDFDNFIDDSEMLLNYIRNSLLIKKKFIEADEFDNGIRNIFNYGHSFGHAIESATNFSIPHGIAVSIGMDMANYIAFSNGILPDKCRVGMHSILFKNYKNFRHVKFSVEDMIEALKKDKKNTSTNLKLILPVGEKAEIKKIEVTPDQLFINQCSEFLNDFRV